MDASNKYPQLVVAKSIARDEFARDKDGLIASIKMIVWSEIHNTVRTVTFTRDNV